MEIDPNTIVNFLVAIAGAGSVYGGGRFAYNRYRTNRGEPQENPFSNMATTGQIPALDVVTGNECRETRKEITDSIHEVKIEVSKGMDSLSKKMDRLFETVGQTKEALAGQEASIMKTVDRGVDKHECQYHRKVGT